jgi:hypothetical protein
MAAKKLSTAQIGLLRSVALGKVWRDDRGRSRPLYTWCVEGEARSVSRTFDALYDAGLASINFTDRHRPVATLTDAGRETLESSRPVREAGAP